MRRRYHLHADKLRFLEVEPQLISSWFGSLLLGVDSGALSREKMAVGCYYLIALKSLVIELGALMNAIDHCGVKLASLIFIKQGWKSNCLRSQY